MNNTEIEQEFFKVFGIKPKKIPTQPGWCPDVINDYPDISSEKLLQMICIINEFISISNWKQLKYISTFEIETLKENILKDLIYVLNNECNDIIRNQLKQQVQQIFKD